MSELMPLSEVVAAVNDKVEGKKDPARPYVGLEHLPSRGSALLGYASSTTSISTNSVFSARDVLFGKLRPNLRKALSAPFDGYCSTDILVLRAREGIDSGFAGRLFQSEGVGSAAERTAIGTKMPRTSWAQLRGAEVFVPPEPEQRQIAHILDTLDTQIRRTEELIGKLTQIKQGLLTDLLTRGIDENGQLRPPPDQAPHLYKDSPLGRIPREWDMCQLTELGVGGLMNGVFKEPARVGEGIPLVNVADLYRSESVHLDECERFSAYTVEIDRFGVKQGDIFFTRSSLKLEGIAHTSFLANDPGPAVFECHVMRLRPNQAKIWPRFLKEWCVGAYARRHFMANAKQVTMTTISQDGIASLLCPVPALEEQGRAVNRLESLDARLRNERDVRDKLAQQKSALMDDLLTGRVRVTPLLDQAGRAAS